MMKKRKYVSCLFALAFTLSLCVPAVATDSVSAPQAPSSWSHGALADAYALGLVDDDYAQYIQTAITMDDLSAMTEIIADKLALLNLPPNTKLSQTLVIDSTRGGVINAFYQEAAAYALPNIEQSAADYLVGLGVVKGGQNGERMLSRSCTFEEAMVMAQRLILTLYDRYNAGSKGLLWKATNGANTLYLLGTIHMDRGNVYPLHKSLREAVAASQEVIFEVNFNDEADVASYQAMQIYSDGTSLKDHLSAELYADTVAVFTHLGMTEAEINTYKPWVLMLTLTNALAADESTSSNAVAVDAYLNTLATNAGKEIGAVETLAFQGAIFDGLSAQYQLEGLAAYVAMMQQALSGKPAEGADQKETQAALEAQDKQYDTMMKAWVERDPEAMATLLDKATAVSERADELSAKLFTQRDPNMIKAAAEYLERAGSNTFFMAVGAGHMLDPGGIVSGLQHLGYHVELVP